MKLANSIGLLLLTAMLATTGCVKKRATEYGQGQGTDAQPLGTMDKQVYSLDTQDAIRGTQKTAALDEVTVSNDLDGVLNNMPLVTYTTTATLLGNDLPVRGKPNTHYEVRYELTDTYMRVLKVGAKQDIPIEEWPYAITLDDGKLGVPLVGYPVKYFKIDYQVNEDNVKTSRLIELPVADRNGASHFRIDRTSRTVFSAVQKVDVYPADYFKGDWYYQSTVISVRAGQEDELGQATSMDSSFAEASRIRIDFQSKKSLRGINLNVDARIPLDDVVNQNYAFTLPVEWKDYRAERQGRGPGMKEEENNDNIENFRKYVLVHFDQIITATNVGLEYDQAILGKTEDLAQLEDLTFTKDFFSFTVLYSWPNPQWNPADPNSSRLKKEKERFAFSRINPKAQLPEPRPYSERDSRTFGYFVTYKNFEWDRNIQRKADLEAMQLMSRFSVGSKEIVYHFSKDTPQEGQPYGWVREMARNAVNFWDQAFQLAGTNIHIRLDETADVDLGDIRYNVLNITNPLLAGGLLGYGPSLADTRTGEIISATTNIQMTGFVAGFSSQIRMYMREQLGQLNLNLTGTPFDGVTPTSVVAGATTSGTKNYLAALANSLEVVVDKDGNTSLRPMEFWAYSDARGTKVEKQTVDIAFSDARLKEQIENISGGQKVNTPVEAIQRLQDLAATGDLPPRLSFMQNSATTFSAGADLFTKRRIQQLCPEIDTLVQTVKANGGKITTAQETPIVEGCAEKLMKLPTLQTILHEMGHNFSLRHNFTCSNDKANFYTADEIRKTFKGLKGTDFPEEFLPFGEDPNGSCVMDYMSEYGNRIPVPGKYDIAAIRFIYTDKVELKDGTYASTSEPSATGGTQFTAIADLGNANDVKAFKYCTDEDLYRNNNPMCSQFDDGLTPEQTVDYYIEEYWNSLVNANYRYGRQYSPIAPYSVYNRIGILIKLKRFYDEWRFHVAEYTGQKDQYLERFDDKAYQAKLVEMSKSPGLGERYAEYKPVRDKIVDFLISVAYLPNRYCVGQTADKHIVATEFSKLQSEVALVSPNAYTANCEAPEIKDLLTQRGLTFVGEVGQNISTAWYSTAIEDLKEYPDVWGTEPDRLVAAGLIGQRAANSQIHASRNFYPSMMDEPDLRSKILNKYVNRILGGVDLATELAKIPAIASNPDIKTLQVSFNAESDILSQDANAVKMGLLIPGKTEINQARLGLFDVGATRPGTQDFDAIQKQGAAFLDQPNGTVLYALKANTFSYMFINRITNARVERELARNDFDANEVNGIVQKFVPLFPTDASKFTGTELNAILTLTAQVMSDAKVSDGAKVYLSQLLGPYQSIGASIEVAKGISLNDAIPQLAQIQAEIDQIKADFKAKGIPDVAPVDPTAESADIKAIRKTLKEDQDTLAGVATALAKEAVGANLLQQGKGKAPFALDQASFIKSAADEVTQVVALKVFDPEEFDGHVNLLLRVLTGSQF